jgi:hypothetical protein
MTELVIEEVALDSLTPHPRNVRQGDVGAIMESLKAHGQYKQLLVQRPKKNSPAFILAGNHTWRAMKELGWQTCKVSFRDVDDDEALRILLVDNKTNDLATYNDAGLALLLEELANTKGSLQGTGFDGDDLDDLLFRLNGDVGTVQPGQDVGEAAVGYLARGIKSFVLPYPGEEWETMNILFAKLRDELNIDNNSDAIHFILEERFGA